MIPRYVMIGGFLGAGKTTAMIRIAERLTAEGLRVGLITNDQSGGLVDTTVVRARALPVEEIAGGCFCCRFNSLVEAAARLNASARPDVFLAEPVGSCTDLQATVTLPLRQMFGDQFRVAPLSVLMDPVRAARVLGVEGGASFTPKVLYVYRKQLEEAELLVINKIDLVDTARRGRLRDALAREFPRATQLEVSARTGEGVDAWIDHLRAADGAGAPLDIDYDEYAEGEARLGWLNCTARVAAPSADADDLLRRLAEAIARDLAAEDIQIAHLKMTFTPDAGGGIAVLNLVRTDSTPEAPFSLDAMAEGGELTLNLRAEAAPRRLEAAVRRAATAIGDAYHARIAVEHLESFSPARPVPTHRLAAI